MKLQTKLLFLTLVLAAKTVSAAVLATGPVKVTRILDGDTIEVTSKDDYTGLYKNYRVRLNAIDAPEKAQPYGQRSRQYLANLTGGKEVIVNSQGNDRYGRVLGNVLRKRCQPACVIVDVNQEMVRSGMAWAYRYNGKAASEIMATLEKRARDAATGLWADKQPVEPWRYRRLQKGESE